MRFVYITNWLNILYIQAGLSETSTSAIPSTGLSQLPWIGCHSTSLRLTQVVFILQMFIVTPKYVSRSFPKPDTVS